MESQDDDVKRVGVKEDIRSTGTSTKPPAEQDQLRVGVKEDIRSTQHQAPAESPQDDQLRDGKKH